MTYRRILERNRRWVDATRRSDPHFFARLAEKHEPHFLFIGCSDARVPANVITQTHAGEMFVHRNVANLVVPTDTNLLAVLEYAVEALGVSDVFVCGHYGCGGVKAAMASARLPLVDNWLNNIRTVQRLHAAELDTIADAAQRYRRLVELNVVEQVYNLSRTPVVEAAWARGSELRLHGWVYELTEGLLRDLDVTLEGRRSGAGQAHPSAAHRATPAAAGRLVADAR
jgi:carbonic anhydrase